MATKKLKKVKGVRPKPKPTFKQIQKKFQSMMVDFFVENEEGLAAWRNKMSDFLKEQAKPPEEGVLPAPLMAPAALDGIPGEEDPAYRRALVGAEFLAGVDARQVPVRARLFEALRSPLPLVRRSGELGVHLAMSAKAGGWRRACEQLQAVYGDCSENAVLKQLIDCLPGAYESAAAFEKARQLAYHPELRGELCGAVGYLLTEPWNVTEKTMALRWHDLGVILGRDAPVALDSPRFAGLVKESVEDFYAYWAKCDVFEALQAAPAEPTT